MSFCTSLRSRGLGKSTLTNFRNKFLLRFRSPQAFSIKPLKFKIALLTRLLLTRPSPLVNDYFPVGVHWALWFGQSLLWQVVEQ